MPHDLVSLDLSLSDPVSEISPHPHKEKSSILDAMKEAGRSLVASVKHAGTKGVLSAAMAAGAALGASQAMDAQTVTTTVTGTVGSGTDTTGVFGFAPGTDMTGQNFKLVINIDASNGSPGSYCGANGSAFLVSSPGDTAVLQIGSGSYLFGALPGTTSFDTSAYRCIQPSGSLVEYNLHDYSVSGANYFTGSIEPAVPSNWTTNPNWEAAYTNSALNTSYQIGFDIGTTLGGGRQTANGYLMPSVLTISGPQATNPLAKSLGNTGATSDCGCSGSGTPAAAQDPISFTGGGLLSVPQSSAGMSVTNTGQPQAGEPVSIGTGNVFEQVTDYSTVGQNPLQFIRYYNSMGNATGIKTNAVTLGTNWRSNYDRYLQIGATTVAAERPDGQVLSFTLSGSTWVSDTDVDFTLTNSGSTWTLKDHSGNTETYTATGSKGLLQTIAERNGYTQTLAYSSGLLSTVTDSYSRELSFTYSGGLLDTVTTPDTLVLTYAQTPVTGSGNQLTSVSYNTSPVTNQTYNYANAAFPFALTSITDENGNDFASWTYDNAGRATSSQLGNGSSTANLTTFAYNSNGTVTVTNALGVEDTYTFTTLQNVPKVTGISRAATSTTAAATQSFGYDSNGYLNSMTDWNGNQTTYVNNSHGQPTTINEAVGSSVARSTAISYDPTWVHQPHQIITPGLTSTFVYDGSGNPLTRTDLDTTTNSLPYSTNGQTRVTTWTWSSTGQETSIKLPRTDLTAKTTFTYTGGTLTQISDALSHLTKITTYTGGGLPKTILDPNSVTTTLAYDARLNLHTSTLATTAGNLVTTYTHDAANELTAVQLPDNSKLTYGYDTAHRLTTITDLFSNSVNYTLDELGDKTLIQVKNSTGTVKQSHSGTFDALGRVLTDVGGMSQTTTYTWDKNSNVLTIAPPSPSGTITETWDALNRLATRADPSPGGTTTFTFDAHNKPLSVKDANTHSTTYVNNGFGDRTQTVSPDSGTTVYYYNGDRDLTQRVQAGSLTANLTWDALDRNLTVKYTGDTTLNVTRTYDQTGHGFGVGRLTSVADQPGSDSFTYDERGNVTNESRVITSVGTLTTATAFDAASNITSITYPSTTLVSYTRDSMGRVTAVTAKPPSGTVSNVATSVTYEPFGPVTGLTFGNGITGTYGYDADYRPTTRVDTATSAVLNLSYTYFTNNSVNTITDSVNTANSQTLGYNAVDALTSATSGTGGYGTYGWTWDAVGNVKTQVINGTTTTFNLTAGTNKLASIVTGSTTENVTSTAAGNINTLKIGSTTQETLTYNNANQLASETTPGTAATYKYGETGERLEKTVSGSNPVVFQYGQAARELLSENDLHSGQRADYVYLNGKPVGEVDPVTKNIYFTHTDALGTPQRLTDSTKTVDWNATYAPFGNTVMFSGTLVNQSLRLPGQYFDPETTMNHNGFRDYAGAMTRYVETDPIGLAGGMNTYQYVKGNPLKYTDPSGEISKEEFTKTMQAFCLVTKLCAADPFHPDTYLPPKYPSQQTQVQNQTPAPLEDPGDAPELKMCPKPANPNSALPDAIPAVEGQPGWLGPLEFIPFPPTFVIPSIFDRFRGNPGPT